MLRLGLTLALLTAVPAVAGETPVIREAYADPPQMREAAPPALAPQSREERLRAHRAAATAAREAQLRAESHEAAMRQARETEAQQRADATRREAAARDAAQRARVEAIAAKNQKQREIQEQAWDRRTRRTLGTICQGC